MTQKKLRAKIARALRGHKFPWAASHRVARWVADEFGKPADALKEDVLAARVHMTLGLLHPMDWPIGADQVEYEDAWCSDCESYHDDSHRWVPAQRG